ncbi:MAG: hypothetical protein JO340_20740 [Acidobacteriaceae bacterium]|nr:hypothetical protein [Acidobacteriaceae bacterium]
MTKQLQFGLVAEGESRHSEILRLPRLDDYVGPVKSSSFGAARKLSNYLRAGYPITDYEELQAARVILLRIPDAAVPRIISELCSAGLVLSSYSFVLCESWLTTDALAPLRAAGANVATVISVPTEERKWFLMEGQQTAIRLLRAFIERNQARALEIRPGTKHLCFAAELLATALPMPLLIASQQALRETGLASHNLTAISEEMIREMFRGFLKGARMNWGGPLNDCAPALAEAHLEKLRLTNPEIAGIIDRHLPLAREAMSKYRVEREAPE